MALELTKTAQYPEGRPLSHNSHCDRERSLITPLHRIQTQAGIKTEYPLPLSGHIYCMRHISRQGYFLIAGSKKLHLPRLSFGILDVAFSPDALCLSEASGPVGCVDVETAEEKWRYQPPTGSHVMGLSYQGDYCFYGVQWAYEQGGPVLLLQFSVSGGTVRNLRCLNSFPDAFGFGPGELLLSSGDVVSLLTGSIIRHLAFPVKEYPDPESTPEASE